MKTVLLILLAALGFSTAAPAQNSRADTAKRSGFDEATRFVFHAVLEGLYEDGVSDADVKQILMRKEKQTYFHFILSCPLCGTTIWALEAYRDRPKGFYGLKTYVSTFGPGLTEAQHAQLFSDDPKVRLTVINALVQTWLERRMKAMRLTDGERAQLLDALEKKRQAGMDALVSFRKKQHGENLGVAEAAPAYVGLEECAVCNAAVGKPMKLPDAKPEK
jgi:hypothetical protein